MGIIILADSINSGAQKRPVVIEEDCNILEESSFFDTEKTEKFKTAMHAFISLVSMENIGCEFLKADDPGCYTCLIEEFDPGWNSASFHDFLQIIFSRIKNLSPQAEELLQTWKLHSQRFNDFFASKLPVSEHRVLLNNLSQNNDVVIYPWAADHHRVYVELKRKENNLYRIRVFDLGAGRSAVREDYQPIEHDNLSRNEYVSRVRDFIDNYGGVLNKELLAQLYGVEESICISCAPEYAQKTGNCVVKNFLAAMQQDAIDRYGNRRGIAVFAELYIGMLNASLAEAEQHIERCLVTPLPSFEQLCNSIARNQMAFTGTSKDMLQPIFTNYQKIRAFSVIETHNARFSYNVCTFDNAVYSTPLTFFEENHIDRDTRLRKFGSDIEDITTFLDQLQLAMKSKKLLSEKLIPLSLINYENIVDSHQPQHLKGPGYRNEKGHFYQHFATSEKCPVLIALANCTVKLVSEYYQQHLKTNDREKNKQIKSTTNFIVDFEINLGIDIKAGNQHTSCVFLEGFSGKNCHIYPVVPEATRSKHILIKARQMIFDATIRSEVRIR